MFTMNSTSQLKGKLRDARREAGIAYVVLLIYLTIMTCLGLSFIQKVGLETKIVMNKTISSQAHYLAESAASHAMWGMLNVPGFASDGNMYYMHDFAGGRYGYKVRKPTLTTFATVATIGVLEESVVEQGYVPYILPSNVFTVYGSTTNSLPFHRRLIGADWGVPSTTPTGGSPTVYWAELEGCPVRKELVAGVIDSNSDIKLSVWNGSTWGNQHTFSITADMNYKCFDIAYESQSGKALVVGRDGSGSAVRYNIWNGTAWAFASPQIAFSISGGTIQDVVMASQPGGDEILIAVVSSLSEIQLVRWNGSSFSALGTIETTSAHNDFRVVEIVYEHQSGDAMVVWSRNGDSALKFRMWNGATLGPEGSLPDFGRVGHVIRGAADSDPTSDHIIIGAIDNFYDINLAVWDGDGWVDSREIETQGANYWVQCFDIAWESSGNDALVVFSKWGETNVRILTWKKGTALADSTVKAGPSFQGKPWMIRLLPIAGTEKIVLLGTGESNELRYCLWTGNKLRGNPGIVLEPGISASWDIAFALAEADVPRTGGTGSGASGNQPPVVDAGPEQTISLSSDATLDGTVTDDGLPDPPATVTTTWTKESGPGTVTFGDASQVDTTATFSETGTYVLRLTADDSDLTGFDEVTIIVVSCPMLLVVGDSSSLTSAESERKALMEGWGWMVTVISDDATQSEFDTAAASNEVAYISQQAIASTLGDKLNNTPIGVVNENKDMIDDFGFATGVSLGGGLPTLNVDMSHYITAVFTANPVSPYVANDWYQIVNEPVASGVEPVATWVEAPWTGKPSLMALSQGAQLIGGGSADGRRVQIPWGSGQGSTPVALASLSDDAKTIMKRSIEWAANWEGGCGGGGSYKVLFVVYDATALGSRESGRKALMESWGYTVTLIDDDDTQANFDAMAAVADVVYVSRQVIGGSLGDKLTGSPTAILSEHFGKLDDFGFSSTFQGFTMDGSFTQTDAMHYISEPFSGNPVTVYMGDDLMEVPSGTLAPDLENVAEVLGTPSLVALDTGAQRWDGGTAPARRVHLPFGTVLTTDMTADAHTLIKRAIEWAASGSGGGGPDTNPPTPDPMTWETPPAPANQTSIIMTATAATDPSGVEYYFECTAGGGNDSGWHPITVYIDMGLTPGTSYTYRVKARDKSPNQNETGWSSEASSTPGLNIYVHDIAMGFYRSGANYIAQATVWIKGGGADVSDALVTGDWSGDVSGTSMGSTGGGGTVILDSPGKKGGGTYTFTVTDVTKSGYVYNPALNMETFDSITAP